VGNAFIGVLIFLTDIVFRWIPAAVSVVTGQDLPGTVVTPEATTTPGSPVVTTPVAPAPVTDVSAPWYASLFDTLGTLWNVLATILVFATLMLAMGSIYALIRLQQIRKREHAALEPLLEAVIQAPSDKPNKTQVRWNKIAEQAHSPNPNDWRLAILEADIMLDEMLEAQGYLGESIGEKLKQIEPSDFTNLDAAWEAHKVRNNIAHRGSAHELNEREVQRVIGLYERVFREFHYI
jgi:hypothetical protein